MVNGTASFGRVRLPPLYFGGWELAIVNHVDIELVVLLYITALVRIMGHVTFGFIFAWQCLCFIAQIAQPYRSCETPLLLLTIKTTEQSDLMALVPEFAHFRAVDEKLEMCDKCNELMCTHASYLVVKQLDPSKKPTLFSHCEFLKLY